MTCWIGTAGWSVPAQHAALFPAEGSHLQRYAGRLQAVEINSSFYRPHRPATYARWAASVPAVFRFAVKMPREITHVRRLVDCEEALRRFVGEAGALEEKLGPLLVQLPPRLAFDAGCAEEFLKRLRRLHAGQVVCEPRHASWFTAEADTLLVHYQTARVAADPPPVAAAARPGGWMGLVYRRLHGAPDIYYSKYDTEQLAAVAAAMRDTEAEQWCIFDNTARGEAAGNARDLQNMLVGITNVCVTANAAVTDD